MKTSERGVQPNVWLSSAITVCAAVLFSFAGSAYAIDILLTADAEGHVSPCSTCPMHHGLGGLERRATVLNTLRAKTSLTLLIDAGNWLVGADSIDSKGQIIVTAYNALRYDAVHLTAAIYIGAKPPRWPF